MNSLDVKAKLLSVLLCQTLLSIKFLPRAGALNLALGRALGPAITLVLALALSLALAYLKCLGV